MKSQVPISKHKGRFGILKFGACDLFGICDLLFGIFSHSITPAAPRIKEIAAPGAGQSQVDQSR
jgi:hypothetical protein